MLALEQNRLNEEINKKENKVSELDKALKEFNKEILEGENKLKRNKLFETCRT